MTAALRAVGLGSESGFSKYHLVLNRAAWSSRRASQELRTLLLEAIACGRDLLAFGIDETIERHWDSKIHARGIYRDAVRSSASHFVMGMVLALSAVKTTPSYLVTYMSA